ncbi:hypothetical protein [Methylobacterium sp. J-076]|uniref:hypothetical protein n=1 Tax=Methylobacterium sp. J-076 TaxID=2836655 RepID=UPI001FB9FE9E|nr:hypothetical protein [Methylobacterium sp. J-076]MCJ2011567.1 hypothetical protein [Methylobacterium sp. J-076]
MRQFVSSSPAAGRSGRTLRCALVLAAVLAAGPALAQPPAGSPDKAAATPRTGRSVSATGRTMPPVRNGGQADPASSRTNSDAAMLKAQKAAEARSKEWDSKMHKTMGTICHGC